MKLKNTHDVDDVIKMVEEEASGFVLPQKH